MRLFTSPRAPNPRRVLMFIAEKAITGIEIVPVDLAQGQHRSEGFLALNPLGQVPVLDLGDGRTLS